VRFSEPLEPRLLLATNPASMVKDLNAVTAPSDPFSFIAFKGATYFRANDGVHGVEWFRTDGTPGGTSMLLDLNPGAAGSFGALGSGVSEREVATAAMLGDALLFTATGPGGTGNELWKTDGTADGTVLVKDIRPNAFPSASSSPRRFMVVGDTLYFTADDGTNGRQLWKTDGTEAGTQRVSDVPNTDVSMEPVPLGAVNGKLVFAARQSGPDDAAGRELYVTDGTPAGTTLLKNINPSGGSNPGLTGFGNPTVAVVNNVLYLPATDNLHGRELWRTDGTPEGTVLVAELPPGTGSSSPANLTDVNGNLYFTAQPNGFDSMVYRRDPTGGISEVPPPTAFPPTGTIMSPGSAGNVGGVFYVAAWYSNQATLFKHDPASNIRGLTVVKSLASNTSFPLNAGPILDVGGKALLLAPGATGDKTIHLWRSDGTAAGTVDLATFQDQPVGLNSTYPQWHLVRGAGGLVYFSGQYLETGTEPVRTDGTEAGTFRLADLNTNTLSSNPTAAVYLGGGKSVFTAEDPVHGRELWVTDGTAAGTSLLKDIFPGTRASFRVLVPDFSPAVNGRTFFAASSSGNEVSQELWTTDGTPEGTYRLPIVFPRNFQALHGKVYFVGTSTDPSDMKGGLWESDGTVAGTRFVAPLDGTAGPLVRNGDQLYFTLLRYDTGSEIWKSDSTAEGTMKVSALSPSTDLPSTPAVMDGVLYVTAATGSGTPALWRSDGTPPGTTLVKELPGRFLNLLPVGHRLLLSRGSQPELVTGDIWVSDGTPAGTVALDSLVPALQGFQGDTRGRGDPQLTVVGDAAYFFGRAGDGDPGVWRTDGTAAGTRLVHTFARGTTLTAPSAIDGLVYFTAGSQLWRTDGTDAGTVLVQDVPASNLVPAGGAILFTGSDPAHGTELWAMPRDATEVYVRGSAWADSFKSYVQDNSLGADGYGYRVNAAHPPTVLPWVNIDQVIVRLPLNQIGGMPGPCMLSIQSQRGAPAFVATAVNPVAGDPQAFVFRLNRPLGGDGTTADGNGDRLTVTIYGAGPQFTNLVLRLNVLQGDVDASGSVLANDFAAVKRSFFKRTTSPTDPADPSSDYSPFRDVDGSGAVLADDFAAVKRRFFQSLPAAPTPAPAPAATARPGSATRELFSSAPLLT
jgi:ELWxxDGT repeat protein